jgi:NADP-dependent aldehyde dehydrogenase
VITVITSFDPRTGNVAGHVPESTLDDVGRVAAASLDAAKEVSAVSPARRASWLGAVADELEARAAELAGLADLETGLGAARLTGELARTTAQLRFYGAVAEEGSYLRATIDAAGPSTPAVARAGLPIGPVAVFGASNFPFAFGVLGHDTASAIAAGCPVVAKAHPAHPLLCQALHELAASVLAQVGAPDGTFGMVAGYDAGAALVRAPEIAAVAFTGSQRGGMALVDLANQRDLVIPVFAEMGTVNPVVVSQQGAHRIVEITDGFVGTFTLGFGQFCTKPGLMFAPRGADAPSLVASSLARQPTQPQMLTEAIARSVADCLLQFEEAGAKVIQTVGSSDGPGWSAPAAVVAASIDALTPGSRLLEECFGAVALVVEYDDQVQLESALDRLQGSLAASVFTAGPDDSQAHLVLRQLTTKVGRVVVNGWPTGVACGWAQHHGGPWPSTSNPAATSVGAAALDRFMRPLAYQAVPDEWLPEPLQRDNPWSVPRRVDGRLELPATTP